MFELDKIFDEWATVLKDQTEVYEDYQKELLEEVGDPMGEIGCSEEYENYSDIRGI